LKKSKEVHNEVAQGNYALTNLGAGLSRPCRPKNSSLTGFDAEPPITVNSVQENKEVEEVEQVHKEVCQETTALTNPDFSPSESTSRFQLPHGVAWLSERIFTQS
jgi:hypothetical protein